MHASYRLSSWTILNLLILASTGLAQELSSQSSNERLSPGAFLLAEPEFQPERFFRHGDLWEDSWQEQFRAFCSKFMVRVWMDSPDSDDRSLVVELISNAPDEARIELERGFAAVALPWELGAMERYTHPRFFDQAREIVPLQGPSFEQIAEPIVGAFDFHGLGKLLGSMLQWIAPKMDVKYDDTLFASEREYDLAYCMWEPIRERGSYAEASTILCDVPFRMGTNKALELLGEQGISVGFGVRATGEIRGYKMGFLIDRINIDPNPTWTWAEIQAEQTLATLEPFPLSKGNYWIYDATVAWESDNETHEKNLKWEMKVLDAFKNENTMVAVVRGHPSDLAWYKPETKPSQYLIIKNGNQYYKMRDDGLSSRLRENQRGVEQLLLTDDLILDLPLTPGKSIGPPHDGVGMYCWYVEETNHLSLDSVIGVSGSGEREEYTLVFRTNPDTVSFGFVPGIGINRYFYNHHGTVSAVDAKLVECHLVE